MKKQSISQLSKHTNSLQSMILMNAPAIDLQVGYYLTTYYYTDRRSVLITEVEGNLFTLENGVKYRMTPNGRIQFFGNDYFTGKMKWITEKNVRITQDSQHYFDPHF